MALTRNDNKEILLTICIPTYNRAKKLDETLKSITSQEIFNKTNKIEIIVSDNFSSDNTMLIVNNYREKFFNKIIYSRNFENIYDKNFEKVLSLGSGTFLKLNNDTLVHKNKSLEKIVKIIEENINNKSILFFSNGLLNIQTILHGRGLDFFLKNATFYSTWIATFGIWKNDFDNIINFNKCSHLQLTQVDILFHLIEKKGNIVIIDDILFETENVTNKGGYDIVTVFLDNYSYLLRERIVSNEISKELYYREMDNVINKFLAIWLAKSFVDNVNFNFILNKPLKRINKFYNYNIFKLLIFYKNFSKQCLSEISAKLRFKKYG